MTAVFVLRHPETTWNVAQRYQGRLDAPLSEAGRRQAELVAKAFPRGSLDHVISSPMRRARDLGLELASGSEAPLTADERFTEIGMGAWEGLYLHEIRARHPELYDRWYLTPDTVTFPAGESLADVRARALSALAAIFARWPDGNVAVITHSAVIQVLVSCALGLDLRYIHRIRVANAGITTLCGTELPGSVLSVNVTEPLYHSPAASADAQSCARWKPRRIAS